MKTIDAQTLQKYLQSGEAITLIDVREPWEHELFSIGGRSLPLSTLFKNVRNVPRDKTVVLYCEKGIRSSIAIQRLADRYGYDNLINLTGGLTSWKTL